MNRKRLIIIGGDAAGMSAASQAKKRNKDLDVLVLERGDYISYAACGMPYMVSGVIKDPDSLLILTPEKARANRGIDVRTRHEVVSVDLKNCSVTVKAGKGIGKAMGKMMGKGQGDEARTFEEHYDGLVFATGARPRLPAAKGINLEGVMVLRDFADGLALKDRRDVKDVVIVGAGLVGLEMAESFRRLERNVTMLKRSDGPLLDMDPALSELVEQELVRNGCVLLKGSPLEEMVGDDSGKVVAVRAGGETRRADLVLLATGVAPNSEPAREAGLKLGVKDTIAVNEHLATSHTGVFAAGDCVSQIHRVSHKEVFVSQALAANRSGKIAGANVAEYLSGGNQFSTHPGTMATVLTKVFDLQVGTCGLTVNEAKAAGFETGFTWIKQHSRSHYYPGGSPLFVGLVYERKTGRLLGGQIVGKEGGAKRLDVLVTALSAKMDLETLSRLDLSYCPPYSPPWDPVLIAASIALKSI